MTVKVLTLAAALCLGVAAAAQEGTCNAPGDSDNTYLPHVPGTPVIDGQVDEDYWQSGVRVPVNIETRPGENIEAPVASHAILAENGKTLFVAFVAEDPEPEKIRAFLRDRDSAWDDDFVGIVLDTFNDERQAFEFFANALGAQMDLTINDVTDNEDDSWDAIWDSAGKINERGYEVEMAIPLQQLRFPKAAGPKTWGINLLRFYPRSNRHRLANVANDRNRNCYLCQLQKFDGLACAEPGRNLVVAPALTVNRSETRDDPLTDPLVKGDVDIEPSLDVRWGVTPDLTLVGTINPDFSQVEADVAQLAVNNTFTLFFPEARPFFLDGAEFFETPRDVVFTRTIADPDFGGKALLKRGANNLGIFTAQDTVTQLLFPGPEGSDTDTLDDDYTSIVARYRRDVGDNSALGAILTSREGSDYRNRVTGVDGKLRFNDTNTLQFQYLHSTTRYPQAIAEEYDQPLDEFSGHLGFIDYRYRTRNWSFKASYEDTDSDFRADSGFITRVDANRWVSGGNVTWYPENSAWTQITMGGDWDITHRDDGTLQEREVEGFVFMNGPLQSEIEFGGGVRDRLFDGRLFDERFAWTYLEFQPMSGVFLGMFAEVGDQVDFANTRLGKLRRIDPRVTLQIGRHLQLRVRHNFRQLETQEDERIFTANLTDARLTYQFDNRSFLRLVVQHRDIDRNTAVYVDEADSRSRALATQLLYSYKVNPQTVLFLGYSDGAEDGDRLDSFVTTDRTLFAKIGYAWLP